jgi:hypothetical protein
VEAAPQHEGGEIDVLGWLDYRHKLTCQNPNTKYRVIYNTSGTFLTAAIVEGEDSHVTRSGHQITTSGYVVDTKTYCCELENGDEASFLVALLNAPIIDELVKPLQSRGLWGPRDIHKKVLELPIPQYDASNSNHERLAELGRECSSKMEHWLAGGGAGKITSIGKLRSMGRALLREELAEIDLLVKGLLASER